MGVATLLPFLVYHDVVRTPRNLYDINVEEFIRHVEIIEGYGWSTVLLRDFLDWHGGKGTLPVRPLVLTFDDGYAGHGETVYPLLAEKGLSATFFVSVGLVGEKDYLSWEQILRMDRGGMEIGSHGLSHRPLSLMGDDELRRELLLSRAILGKCLGHPVDILSVPRGYYSRRVREYAAGAGYRAVCTSRISYNNRSSDPHDLGRLWIRGRRDIEAVLEERRGRFILQRSLQVGRELARASMGYSLYNRFRRGLLGERAGKYDIEHRS